MKTYEVRNHSTSPGRSEMGRSFIWIKCPFCEVSVVAYLWSLAGCGKKCVCGALHSNFGTTKKEVEQTGKSAVENAVREFENTEKIGNFVRKLSE